jgi:hypothetical protein
MVKRLSLLVAAGALLAPGTALAATRTGVVVKVDRPAKLVGVAQAGGRVSLLHAKAGKTLRPGARIAFRAQALRNGTFLAAKLRVTGKARRIGVRGVVLAANRKAGVLVLSAHGAVLKVRLRQTRALSSRGGMPRVGSLAAVALKFDGRGGSSASSADEVSPTASAGEIEGRITALGPGTITISDDGVSVPLTVPPTIDLSAFALGDEVLAFFSEQAGGSLALTAISGDETAAEADDADEAAGDVQGAEDDVDRAETGDDQQAGDDDGATAGDDDQAAGDDTAAADDDNSGPGTTSGDEGSNSGPGADDGGSGSGGDDSSDDSGDGSGAGSGGGDGGGGGGGGDGGGD